MHEFSMMSQIIDLIISEAESRDAEQIEHVKLEIGEFTFLGHEQMRFAFGILSKGTIAENSTLDIAEKRGKIRCECGFEGKAELPEDFHVLVPILKCPNCGKIAELIEGTGCTIRDISLVVPDVQVQG